MRDEKQAKGFYQEELEDLRRFIKGEEDNLEDLKDLMYIIDELFATFSSLAIHRFRTSRKIFVTLGVSGFKDVLPVLEWLEERGLEVVNTVDYPQYNERTYICDGDSLRIQASLCGDNPSCKRVPISSKFVEQIEYKFVCDEEE